MTDEKFNPFEVVDADGERSIRGRLSGQPQRIWKSDEILDVHRRRRTRRPRGRVHRCEARWTMGARTRFDHPTGSRTETRSYSRRSTK